MDLLLKFFSLSLDIQRTILTRAYINDGQEILVYVFYPEVRGSGVCKKLFKIYSEYDENIYMKYGELFKIFTTTEAGKLYLNTWFG